MSIDQIYIFTSRRSIEELRKEEMTVNYVTQKPYGTPVQIEGRGDTLVEAYESAVSQCERLERNLRSNRKLDNISLGLCDLRVFRKGKVCRAIGKVIGITSNYPI
ncbi:hypothetical protein J4423_01380 [Candidatus Pacearchaeota archaeon]|nr:hypothetical protein [Candidatus Pacearchaeota archaeon]